jgi:hypothetical protein
MIPLLEVQDDPKPPAQQEVVVRVEGPKESPIGKTWAFLKKYLLGPIPALIVVAVALLLIAMGAKNIQIGGLLGTLLGKKTTKKKVDVANTVPEDRVREDGTLIQPGEPDSKGIVQAKVVPVKTPGLFDDKSKVKITDPDTGKDIEVDVPDGVKPKDIDKVVIVKPEVHVVTVKSTSAVKAEDLDNLLKKYGDL